MTTSAPDWPSTPPPTDPVDLRDWLLAREEAFARLVRSQIRTIVEYAYEQFLATLTASGDPSAVDIIPMEWAVAVNEAILPMAGGLYLDGALAAWVQSPGTAALDADAFADWQRIVNQDALAYQAAATNRLAGVGDTIWNDVRSRTVLGLEQGWTNEELKAEIESLGQFSEQRADTIARTEANAAYNGGNYDAAEALGQYGPVAKTWSATIDRRTRPSHAQANEQTVAFDQPFNVGGTSMDRPHDPLAPADEVVNCRCRVLFLYDGDTDSTGKVWTRQRPQGGATVNEREMLDVAEVPARATLADNGRAQMQEASDRLQAGALAGEPDAKAALGYSRADYHVVNQTLRGAADATEAVTEQVAAIDRAFDTYGVTLDGDITLHRGVSLDPPRLRASDPREEWEVLLERYPAGAVIEDPAYWSTTISRAEAERFAGSYPAIFEIETPAGTRVLGGETNELEFVLRRGSRMEVKSAEFVDGRIEVRARLLPPEGEFVEVIEEATDGVSPEQIARDRKRAKSREARLANAQTPDTAASAAARYKVTPDEVVAARAEAERVRATIREAAARRQLQIYGELDRVEFVNPIGPSGTTDAGWDMLEQVDKNDRARWSRWWRKNERAGGVFVDDALDRAIEAGVIPSNAKTGDLLEWHRQRTAEIDALGAIRAGRMPSARRYKSLDIDALIDADLDGIEITRILGNHPDDAAAYLAQLDRARYAEDAYRALGDATMPVHGPSPWRQDFYSWRDELGDLQYALERFPSEAPPYARARLRELLPPDFDLPDASLEDIYAAIVHTARVAGYDAVDSIAWDF